METFSESLAICAGNSPVTGEFRTQRPVTRNFDVFFDLCLNGILSKQSWGWWFETLTLPLWRHCNDLTNGKSGKCLVSSVDIDMGWYPWLFVSSKQGNVIVSQDTCIFNISIVLKWVRKGSAHRALKVFEQPILYEVYTFRPTVSS